MEKKLFASLQHYLGLLQNESISQRYTGQWKIRLKTVSNGILKLQGCRRTGKKREQHHVHAILRKHSSQLLISDKCKRQIRVGPKYSLVGRPKQLGGSPISSHCNREWYACVDLAKMYISSVFKIFKTFMPFRI